MGPSLSAGSVFLSNPRTMTPHPWQPNSPFCYSLARSPQKAGPGPAQICCLGSSADTDHQRCSMEPNQIAQNNCSDQQRPKASQRRPDASPQVPEHVLTPPESVLLSLKGHHQQATLNNMSLNFISHVDFFQQVQYYRRIFSSLRYS